MRHDLPCQTENGTFGSLVMPEWLSFQHRQSFCQIPTSACGNSPQNTAIGISLAFQLYNSGLLTCPYYHVLHQLKNHAETTEGKIFLPALPRGSASAQAIEAPCHARSRAMHLQATTMLSTTRKSVVRRVNCAHATAHPHNTSLPEQRSQSAGHRLSCDRDSCNLIC